MTGIANQGGTDPRIISLAETMLKKKGKKGRRKKRHTT